MAVLNGLVMLGSGVWLVVLGIWQVAWPGVLGLMMSPFLFPFLMFPGALFAGLIGHVPPSQPRKAEILLACAALCFTATLSGYTIILFFLASGGLSGVTLWPTILWVLSSAVLPWAWLGLKDRDNAFFISLLILMQIMSIVTVWLGFEFQLDWTRAFFVMWGLMAAGACAVLAADQKAAK